MYLKDKTKSINLRISEEDYNEMKGYADVYGMTISKYLRQVIQQNLVGCRLAKKIVDNSNKEELKGLLENFGK